MRKPRQLEFSFPVGRGGARKGAGRKQQGSRRCVSHRARESFTRLRVLHITIRIAAGLPSLRTPKLVALLMNLLRRHSEKEGFRIVEFSIQGNHIHLLCEAESKSALSRAMNSLQTALARNLNRQWHRRGKVFADRYHAQSIHTPTQCRHALLYVLANAKKHRALHPDVDIDPFSTAPWFPFQSHPKTPPKNLSQNLPQGPQQSFPQGGDQLHSNRDTTANRLARLPKPAATPQSWLLRQGWHRAAPFAPTDHPRIPKRRTALKPT